MLMDELHYTIKIYFPGLMNLSPLSAPSALRLGGKTCSPLTNLYLTIMCISTVAYKYLRSKDYICLFLSMNMWLEYKPSVSL